MGSLFNFGWLLEEGSRDLVNAKSYWSLVEGKSHTAMTKHLFSEPITATVEETGTQRCLLCYYSKGETQTATNTYTQPILSTLSKHGWLLPQPLI